jgi:recombination protein RecR
MAFHMLERDREGGLHLAGALHGAMENIRRCQRCRMFSEQALCEFCASNKRDASRICVVESPADVMAVEQGTDYRGLYFVLMGHLSPLDGIGPEELGLTQLRGRLANEAVAEVIIATNSTVEGEATAHYISGLARAEGVAISRIAHGVPVGGELEYVDGGTLAHAFAGRRPLE